ncbi:MAG: hypothetical protein V3V08_16890 [Nannocystaceae bacterium]
MVCRPSPLLGACGALALFLFSAIAICTWCNTAHASVLGTQGIEMEGPRDRRGFYLGPGLSFGAQIPAPDGFLPGVSGSFHLGGGVSPRLLLGVDLGLARYFAAEQSVGLHGDVEITSFLLDGLYVRGKLGLAAVPAEGSLAAAAGGGVGVGYEMWLNQTAAMDMGAQYDLRAVPGDEPDVRHTFLVGLRFTWY